MLQMRTQPFGSGFITASKELQHAQHVFGTKGEASPHCAEDTVRTYTERLGGIAHMRQVHGDHVAFAHGPGVYEEADAIYTDHRDLWIAVKTADCVPVLVSSPYGVGAAHCGWRGLQNGLLHKLLDKMATEFNLTSSDLFIHIGPCIRQRNYEVDESFLLDFDEKHFFESENSGKLMMDCAGIARSQAMNFGFLDLNIHDSGLCTYERDDLFNSYRRSQQKREQHNVQLSLVRRFEI